MLRAPKSADLFHAPPDFLSAGVAVAPVSLPLGGRVDPKQLRRLARLMAARGHRVQLARMGYDRIYAADCLATAHASEDQALRALALALFPAFAPAD